MKFLIMQIVECDTLDQAKTVVSERLSNDEDYGFDYRFGAGDVAEVASLFR